MSARMCATCHALCGSMLVYMPAITDLMLLHAMDSVACDVTVTP